MLDGTLKLRNGKLYVVYGQTLDSEPKRKTMWWRVVDARGYWASSPESGDIARSSYGGSWNTSNQTTLRSTGSVSTGDGSTPAEFVEESSVAPPAARGKELRWHHGRWEKLIASGWVPAGEAEQKKKKKKKKPRTGKKSARQFEAEITAALEDK